MSVVVLLGHVGFLSRLSQGFNQGVCIFIDDERGDRIVEGLLKSGWSCFPMNATWKEVVFGEGLHRPIMVGTKLALIDICPGRNRPFELIKSFLRLLASNDLQPGDSLL